MAKKKKGQKAAAFESRVEMMEAIDSEVDPYTSGLTKWLNESNYNVYYLSQALDEYREKDGFRALAQAQYLAIEELWNEVFSLFEK